MRKIDFQIELLALENDMRLGGSEGAKGYGGFTTRIRLSGARSGCAVPRETARLALSPHHPSR